jgi:uncharacterized membrane protein
MVRKKLVPPATPAQIRAVAVMALLAAVGGAFLLVFADSPRLRGVLISWFLIALTPLWVYMLVKGKDPSERRGDDEQEDGVRRPRPGVRPGGPDVPGP